jgi:hypothetical protein
VGCWFRVLLVGYYLMKKVPDRMGDTKASGANVQVKLIEDGKGATQTGVAQDENAKRATEIGPVLEEILHSHWEHWGLND